MTKNVHHVPEHPSTISPVHTPVKGEGFLSALKFPLPLDGGGSGRGCAFGGAHGRTDVPKIVDWYMDGKINIDDLITHTMALDDINDAFELMHEGKSIRSVVVF